MMLMMIIIMIIIIIIIITIITTIIAIIIILIVIAGIALWILLRWISVRISGGHNEVALLKEGRTGKLHRHHLALVQN